MVYTDVHYRLLFHCRVSLSTVAYFVSIYVSSRAPLFNNEPSSMYGAVFRLQSSALVVLFSMVSSFSLMVVEISDLVVGSSRFHSRLPRDTPDNGYRLCLSHPGHLPPFSPPSCCSIQWKPHCYLVLHICLAGGARLRQSVFHFPL